jgi:hypothetical protein
MEYEDNRDTSEGARSRRGIGEAEGRHKGLQPQPAANEINSPKVAAKYLHLNTNVSRQSDQVRLAATLRV